MTDSETEIDLSLRLDRLAEVKRHIDLINRFAPIRDYSEDVIRAMAHRLSERSSRKGIGCLDVGGSGVINWLKMQLNDAGMLFDRKHAEAQPDEERHITCILHFWPWDDTFGPPEPSLAPDEGNTMRSPMHRLIDATPVNKPAFRVAGYDDSQPGKTGKRRSYKRRPKPK